MDIQLDEILNELDKYRIILEANFSASFISVGRQSLKQAGYPVTNRKEFLFIIIFPRTT